MILFIFFGQPITLLKKNMKNNVKTSILEYCKNNDENIVTVTTENNVFTTTFDKHGKTKTTTFQVDIFNYIFNVVRFAPRLKGITINGIDIGEFKLKELEHEKDY